MLVGGRVKVTSVLADADIPVTMIIASSPTKFFGDAVTA